MSLSYTLLNPYPSFCNLLPTEANWSCFGWLDFDYLKKIILQDQLVYRYTNMGYSWKSIVKKRSKSFSAKFKTKLIMGNRFFSFKLRHKWHSKGKALSWLRFLSEFLRLIIIIHWFTWTNTFPLVDIMFSVLAVVPSNHNVFTVVLSDHLHLRTKWRTQFRVLWKLPSMASTWKWSKHEDSRSSTSVNNNDLILLWKTVKEL